MIQNQGGDGVVPMNSRDRFEVIARDKVFAHVENPSDVPAPWLRSRRERQGAMFDKSETQLRCGRCLQDE